MPSSTLRQISQEREDPNREQLTLLFNLARTMAESYDSAGTFVAILRSIDILEETTALYTNISRLVNAGDLVAGFWSPQQSPSERFFNFAQRCEEWVRANFSLTPADFDRLLKYVLIYGMYWALRRRIAFLPCHATTVDRLIGFISDMERLLFPSEW